MRGYDKRRKMVVLYDSEKNKTIAVQLARLSEQDRVLVVQLIKQFEMEGYELQDDGWWERQW